MKARHAAVVAGLALGLMTVAETAKADVIYAIDFDVGGRQISGSVTTDGHSGTLQKNDFVSFDINDGGLEYTNDSYPGNGITLYGNGVSASGNKLLFGFGAPTQSGSFLQFFDAKNSDGATVNFQFYGANSSYTGIFTFEQYSETSSAPLSGNFTIGVSNATLSTVPLPASAPMFGAALVALGAVGYGLKRKAKAAA